VGPLPGVSYSGGDVTYAWNNGGSGDESNSSSSYEYTTTPTPGQPNVLTPPSQEDDMKEQLARQNAQGTRFFGMDERGYPVADGFAPVLDFHLTMDETDYDYLLQNQSFEVYKPFQSARLLDPNGTELAFYSSPGRIRPKGQSTLFLGVCMNTTTIPYQLDMDDTNASQTLFGVERLYLRNHFGDPSYMRDWASHRMLARFGLPYLRARKVRFHINNDSIGLYTLLEAPDQNYVFARSFPAYDQANYALFKVKSLSLGCGFYSEQQLESARLRINETDTPPYEFERGEHRSEIPFLGPSQLLECLGAFYQYIFLDAAADVFLAFVRADTDCGTFLVNEGLIDRDLGLATVEPDMTNFINDNLADNVCNENCANSGLASAVDMENWLKNFAVHAVTLNYDSPLGSGNNYYLAEAGDGLGWKIVPYDHNTATDPSCNPQECNSKLVYWSIVRPTCRSLEQNQLVGPLLTNASLHAQYIEYVRSFVVEVAGNQSFVEELMEHAAAIQEDVAQDFWSSGGIFYDQELSPDASNWDTDQFPLLPLLQARVEEVEAQLAAIDAGTFPRGPHVGQAPVEPWETCVDWRLAEPPVDACGGCEYDGCLEPTWTVPFYCEPSNGICYHGDEDAQCAGLAIGGRYDGMEDGTFCSIAGDIPIKTSQCPPDCGGCDYEGCFEPTWYVPSLCAEDGICYHGDVDENCTNIADFESYEGMEDRDGRFTFCFNLDGVPLKASECPPKPASAAPTPDDATAPIASSPPVLGPTPSMDEPDVTSGGHSSLSSSLWCALLIAAAIPV